MKTAAPAGPHIDLGVGRSSYDWVAWTTLGAGSIRGSSGMTIQAMMKNPDNALLPGMFVNAAVVLPAQPEVMVLPETAVEYTLYGDSVYVIREDGKDAKGDPILKAVRTPVKTGARWGNNVTILDGLKPGDRVVAAGQVKVQSGAQVAISDSPPPQPPETLTRN